MRYYKLLFTFIIILLTSNISSAAFSEGDTFTFKLTGEAQYELKPLKNGDPGSSYSEKSDLKLVVEITDINDKDDELTYELIEDNWYYNSPDIDNETISLNATEVGNYIFRLYANYDETESGEEYISYVLYGVNGGKVV